ncbi:MAG: L-seryl-tRNA(Sec) selenium transferase [Firmicutes bacterium]|nr:L-seryl-tRNA(Sec) selenium transferase [Bacillota bacterium]
MTKEQLLRQLPAVDAVLKHRLVEDRLQQYPRSLVLEAIREVLGNYRQSILTGAANLSFSNEQLISDVVQTIEQKGHSSLCRVINATGVVLHTNLGRAVLSKRAQLAIVQAASGYCNLELNLTSGERGSRYSHVEGLLTRLTGAEAALVVNNNAAAVLLALSAVAKDREVIVSRGQLVEIGGSFRIPEVMAQSGAKLVEVGTTNKTYLADYERAITDQTGLLLKVHPSNYRVVGFTHETSLEELVKLGRAYNLPVMDDLGSGALLRLNAPGLSSEPTVSASVASGADIVTFSGDKLLGGPQSGLIVGKRCWIDRMKKHPLNRALRIDKLTLAALEATLREYLDPEGAQQNIPTLAMLTMPAMVIKERAEELAEQLKERLAGQAELKIITGNSQVGGGAMPLAELPTWLVRVKPIHLTSQAVAAALRGKKPAVLVRIQDDALLIDLRTVSDQEIPALIMALETSLNWGGRSE